ncbi:MAG: TonB-dependent receptor, partial [Saprospiraceae bacterium]
MTRIQFRLISAFICSIIFSPYITGQNPIAVKGTSVLQGIIADTLSKKPLEYATISLINAKTDQVVDGGLTDEKGEFSITGLGAGSYILQLDYIGYKSKKTVPVTINNDAKLKLGRFFLVPESLKLAEVTITSQQEMIEEKVDRLVYNAEKDISSKGGDASDVMRKVPLLTVDLDGNVSLRGSSNVRVLINNKPSSIMAASVADALKQIPADMIKSIEVITSPSARYESEGSVGIINIITKKNTLQGMTLGVDLSAGNRGAMLGLNGNYRNGNMGFSLRGHGRAEYNIKGEFSNTQSTQSSIGLQSSTQSAQTLTQRQMGNYNLGWDWDISKKANLSAGLRFGTRNGLSEQNNLKTETYLPGATIPLISGRNVDSKDINLSYDFNTAYTYTFKPQQELSLLGLLSRNNRTNNFEADLLNNVDFAT